MQAWMASLRARVVLALSALLLVTSCNPYGAPTARAPVDLPASPTDLDELPPKSDTLRQCAHLERSARRGRRVEDGGSRRARAPRARRRRPEGRRAARAAGDVGLASGGARIKTDQAMIDAVACRVGFVGPTPWIMTYGFANDGDAAKADLHLRKALADNPHDAHFNRYGISSIGHGQVDMVSSSSRRSTSGCAPSRSASRSTRRSSWRGRSRRGSPAPIALHAPQRPRAHRHFKGRDVATPMKFAQPGIHRA